MKSHNLRLPQQTKLALLFLWITTIAVIVVLVYNIVHQVQDIPVKSDFSRFLSIIVADTLANHIIWEIILSGLVIFCLTVTVKHLAHQVNMHYKWKSYVSLRKAQQGSNPVIDSFRQKNIRVLILEEPTLIAMTMGFFKPTIVVSTSMIERFQERELTAILYHEYYHYKSLHPLQLFIMHIISQSLAFLPVIKEIVHHYKIWMELLADRYSAKQMGSEAPIAEVLLSITQQKRTQIPAFSVHFANEAVNYRLIQLIDPHHELHVPLFNWSRMIISIAVLQIIFIIFINYCV
ncbi:M48 family metalloprotease [Acinetobacter sp. CUI P1]|nr:M48 family metalloprotease [Acinetobacter sp. CUI P1]